jgi:transcriptional regulator of heat shock response
MKPIRKDEQEYLRNYIADKFRDKRSALESEREIDVEKQAQKNYKKFVSTLKIDSLRKQAEKLEKDYQNFKTQKEAIETAKFMKLREAVKKLEDHMTKWKNIRRWEDSPSFTSYSGTEIKLHNVESYITKVLQEETRKAYDNSSKGRAIKELDAQRESCENALYSGSSLGSVRGYIHNVLTKAKIQDEMPSQLMIENK